MHFLGADPDTDAAKGIDYPETMGGATEEQLKAMVTARAMPESSDDEELLPFKIAGTLSRTLTEAEQAIFEEDGYVVLRGFYSSNEIDMLRDCMISDPLVMGTSTDGSVGKNFSVPDVDGRETKLTLW
eukprot:gene23252-24782_t